MQIKANLLNPSSEIGGDKAFKLDEYSCDLNGKGI